MIHATTERQKPEPLDLQYKLGFVLDIGTLDEHTTAAANRCGPSHVLINEG